RPDRVLSTHRSPVIVNDARRPAYAERRGFYKNIHTRGSPLCWNQSTRRFLRSPARAASAAVARELEHSKFHRQGRSARDTYAIPAPGLGYRYPEYSADGQNADAKYRARRVKAGRAPETD